ncbi:DNA-binding response regulator [Paractinoplanes abujensis]|uniref:DNA-binding NarL/FixJ family response regulator n=1 Tax=Paractinoplanes abujensis TaxID=882441 RepID=A0A7W7FZH3_9ACTN|nr:response regulator transcription factor [Actinoplanes abujensis]MBB4692063.1 DNA-binding NarL/FixJ family response regulator [Actinoplanes abujensis]GID16520.1 DNA-binding response regulator [Actinoplanes abujensis]
MIRVLLVDDERMVCAHLRTILSAGPGIEVAGEAYDGAEAVEAVVRLRPDLVLMDLRMPGVDGLTALDRIATLPAAPRVVVLTTFDHDDYVLRALRAGAAGFLVKSTAPDDLVSLVRAAAGGATVLSPVATQRLIGAAGPRQRGRDLVRGLTERETEVLAGLANGDSNLRIARRLNLSEATVKGYVSRLLVKLGCDNRTQAGLLAQQAGLTAE